MTARRLLGKGSRLTKDQGWEMLGNVWDAQPVRLAGGRVPVGAGRKGGETPEMPQPEQERRSLNFALEHSGPSQGS